MKLVDRLKFWSKKSDDRTWECIRLTLIALISFSLIGILVWIARSEAHATEYLLGTDIPIEEERRCSTYDKKKDYPYPQSVEADIAVRLGGVYSPYEDRCYATIRDTDIEHIVATSEAHDSGLCSADAQTRRDFATDPLNLTLAGPRVNRHEKAGYDLGDWLPEYNVCWYVARVVAIKSKYGLSMDADEAAVADHYLEMCENFDMERSVKCR